jgi:hypothetical protein
MKKLAICSGASLLMGAVLGFLVARQMRPTRAQVASYLSDMGVSELGEFAKSLETQWGMKR